ncbi:serine/threonine-protein kinase [Streptomyces sp. Z26]|uniref:serine/threonine-protein kinase n=1 Tax=Streptomyces sp. Z26 TaxID=2500177 RepID=UPI000EF13EA6|nr:serine/threonine-protein kinase [Streptomyces sp. Z26]RLL68721.1 serine/threonine protein kinase [Streptomyces sp. Z26]
MPPRLISDRYELIEQFGNGGMGNVWRGFDRVLDRPIAIKVVRDDAITSVEAAVEFAKRFRREARITARIQHPGVPQVFDAVLDPEGSYEQLYLVMELIDGIPLSAYIHPEHPLPISWAIAVAAQVSTVLSHAHDVPVVHRDLKPGNVLVARDGTVKVLDFGIASILRTDVTKLTATGRPIGTSVYMSPEQVQGGRITPQSDLYSLGCVLHELLCGRPLFTGSDFQVMRQQVEAAPTPLRQLRADVPTEIEDLIRQLLLKRPDRRPVDSQAVYERLLPFLPPAGQPPASGETGPAGVPDPTGVFRQPFAPRPRRTAAPVTPTPTVVDPNAHQTPVVVPEQLRDEIKHAYAHSNALLEEDRFAQAAEVLGEIVGAAAQALGAESSEVLGLRRQRAAIRFLGGDYRQALPEFDALAEAYDRTAGVTSEDARMCRTQAAHCRAELGQVTVALQQFQTILGQVRTIESDASDEAVDLRRSIGFLLLAESRLTDARSMLEPLHADMCVVYGPDDAETREIANVLARIDYGLSQG